MLWEEIKDVLIMERVYRFTNLRVKMKPDMKESKYVEVQSTKKTMVSSVDQSEF